MPAENLIRRIMRGEKKIRNQGDVMLTYRLGTGDLDISEHIILPNMVNTPQNIKLKRTYKKLKEEYGIIHEIPKAISLDEVGLLGVVGHGDKRKAYDIVRALSTQILVNEVPEDLKVAFVYDSVHSKGWNKYESFTRTQMETGISLVAGTPEKRGKVLNMLAQAIEERKALSGDGVENMKPRYIVFVDDMALLKNHRIVEALRDDLCVCAFTFIVVADCIEKLPENVEYALVDSLEFSGVYSMTDHTCMPMVFDKLSEQKLDKYINYIKSKKNVAERLFVLEKITDYEYAQIESAINGILGIRNNISQYILDSLFQSAESFNKNWKGEAETLFVGKLELLYNAISDTNTAAYNMAMSMSEQASEIYKKQNEK